MAKYYGSIGYAESVETRPSVFVEKIIERKYSGDVLRNTRRLYEKDQPNSKVMISNTISILADPYARENFHNIRYIEFMGSKWMVESVDVNYPRLTLAIGGVYHGPTPGFGPDSQANSGG